MLQVHMKERYTVKKIDPKLKKSYQTSLSREKKKESLHERNFQSLQRNLELRLEIEIGVGIKQKLRNSKVGNSDESG